MNRRLSIALGFLGLIALGAVALSSPLARTSGASGWGGFFDALFTAFSAVCVTGLSVVDITQEYTRFGQIVLLALVEIGCMGLMTCGTFVLIAVGRRLSLSREFSLMNAYGVAEVQGIKGLICWVVGSMLVIEIAGAAVLYFLLGDVYESVFYSVMGFCNAGFGLRADSLAAFAKEPFFLAVMAAETILGGIGFLVIYNLCTYRFLRRTTGARGRLSLHSHVVLRFTLYLLAVAYVAFLVLEWSGALSGFSLSERLSIGFYQAVTPRTCGFSVIPTEDLSPLTRLVYVFLMFIGGAPGSAAAGMKITTFAVLVYTCIAMCRGEQETVISRKSIPYDIVRESIVILMALIVFVALVVGLLLLTESEALKAGASTVEALFFEAVSAITTTGLSVGDTTRELSSAGKCVIMAAMFIGRLGALTVVMLIGERESTRHIRFPTEEIVVG